MASVFAGFGCGRGRAVPPEPEQPASEVRVELPLEPADRSGWFFFRCAGLPVDHSVRVKVVGACARVAWVSRDKTVWVPVATKAIEAGVAWEHTPPASICWYAAFPPYSRDRGDQMVARWTDGAAGLRVKTLGLTTDGDTVDCMVAEPRGVSQVGDAWKSQAPLGLAAPLLQAIAGVDAAGQPVPPPRRAERHALQTGATSANEVIGGITEPLRPVARSLSHRQGSIDVASALSEAGPTLDQVILAQKLTTLRQQQLREELLRGGITKMITAETDVAADSKRRTRKVAKLKSELAGINAKITGIQLQLRALCTDLWFGHSLIDASKATGRDVPLVVESCTRALRESGLNEEGIFRVPGEVEAIKTLQEHFERAEDPLADCNSKENKAQVHNIASCLKAYLRQLEDCVLTAELYDLWIAVGADTISTAAAKLKKCEDMLNAMPREHVSVLCTVLSLLQQIAVNSDINKMPAKNLAVAWAPTLLQLGGEDASSKLRELEETPHSVSAIEFLINNVDKLLESVSVGRSVRDSLYAFADADEVTTTDSAPKPATTAPMMWVESQYTHLTLTKLEADVLIGNVGVDGAFVIRSSHKSGSAGLAITFRACGRVQHMQIELDSGTFTIAHSNRFESMGKLVRHFQSVPLVSDSSGASTVLSCPITQVTAKEFERLVASGMARDSAARLMARGHGRSQQIAVDPVQQINESICISEDSSTSAGASSEQGSVDDTPSSANGADLPSVWILARQTANSPQSSWWVEGFLNRLCDQNDLASLHLRSCCRLFTVPFTNPDGVRHGSKAATVGRMEETTVLPGTEKMVLSGVAHCAASMRQAKPWVVIEVDGISTDCEPKVSRSAGKGDIFTRFETALRRGAPGCFISNSAERYESTELAKWVATTFGDSTNVIKIGLPTEVPRLGLSRWTSKTCQRLGQAAVDAVLAALDVTASSKSSSIC